MVRKVPVTIRHADCDLTGVIISYRHYYGGATVPDDGTSVANVADGPSASSSLSLIVDPSTLDVTVHATGS